MGEFITAVIGILAIAAVISGIVQFIRKRKNNCCGGCSSCPHAVCCQLKQQKKSYNGKEK